MNNTEKNIQSKSTEILLEGVEKHYNKIFQLLKYLCIVFVLLTLGFLVWINMQYAKLENAENVSYLMHSILFFFLLVAIFGIGFISVRNQRNKSKRKLQYFIDTPNALISYEIITGEVVKLTLIGENHKVTFPVGLSSLQIEGAMLEAFPYLQKNKERQETQKDIVGTTPRLDKSELMKELPAVLKPYFDEKYSPKLGCLPIIFGILITAFILSIVGRFGWFNIGIFDIGNNFWGYLILPLLAFGFSLFYFKSDEKKIRNLMRNPENIIWIYLKKTKNKTMGISTADTTNLVIADVKERHYIALFEKEEEVLLWLSSYCPSAIVGFYYEWDEIYNKNPKEFLNLIHNKQPNNE